MPTGIVKVFHPTKGYGFIRRDAGGEDVFIHISAVREAGRRDLRKGRKVSFEIFDNQGKPAAKNVRIEGAPEESSKELISKELISKEPISDETANETRYLMKWKSKSNAKEEQRKPIARAVLEEQLTEAVRTSHAEFEAFAGVIVERVDPVPQGSANWAIRGIKFGGANRDRSSSVLSHCVEEAQREFELSE
jgi:cold shock CspA family protein